MHIRIPADVPQHYAQHYIDNYQKITLQTGRLFLFACDQKIEHLNKDFYGTSINNDASSPEHVFSIAQQGRIGAFATHLGLIARYAQEYPDINYIVKLNGKTDLVSEEQRDPVSTCLWTVQDVVKFRQETSLNICGIGYTIYMGSEYESIMLKEAAHAIYDAHRHGLIAILWIYPRGKSIKDDLDPALAAGATGLAASLGADFVKIKPPHATDDKTSAQWLAVATQAAGTTQVICSGGKQTEPTTFFHELYEQIHVGHADGCATGRNIFQKSLKDALAFTQAIAAMVYDNKDADAALKMYDRR